MNDLNAMKRTPPEGERERAVLCAVNRAATPVWLVEDHLDELAALADTAGADVIERITQPRMKPDPATYIGRGKVSEVTQRAKNQGANLVIFDDDLTPVQVRNLEQRMKLKVIDRSGLILDIFARRARTREAKVQVELAQLEYYYPRLTRMWTHLRGQQGGIGFRGPGETQLEVDRRIVQRRITQLKKQLAKIGRQRETRRRSRRRIPTAALVGYTNVGKSTLLNALSGTDSAFVENRLFATLDPKWRRVESENGRAFIAIDTVGFIRKLPHHLVASFRSTLEEASTADLIVHVADLSHPLYDDQIEQTRRVIEQLEFEDKPTLLVFNKIDRVQQTSFIEKARQNHPDSLFLSATTGLRVWELQKRLERILFAAEKSLALEVSPDQLRLLQEYGDSVELRNKQWHEGVIRLTLAGQGADLANALRTIDHPIPQGL